jgi:LysM repeat protein
MPTFTPLPPIDYAIKLGDMCSSIAAIFNVSIQSIVTLNNLPPDCGVLSVGQKVQIPQPTPTASPMPTSTLSALDATEEACQKLAYEVKENDTLSGIARNYNISIDAIKDYNGLTSDNVLLGTKIIIPLCKRYPTPGPTPTATLPPPYAAPNLLLPADGAVFQAANDTITLQWASVGILRPNEAYAITIEDLTEGTGRKITDYVTDSKYIVPSSFRPTGDSPHIMRWTVIPVRQAGTTTEGKQTWDSAGTRSTFRVFSWWGANVATPTP